MTAPYKFFRNRLNSIGFLFRVSAIVLAVCSHSFFAQSDELRSNRALWTTRSESLTDRLTKRSNQLSDTAKAVLYAETGSLWSRIDRVKADSYFERSVDALFFTSSEEIKAQNKQWVEANQQVLKLIGTRNPKQTSRVISLLSDSSNVSAQNNKLNSDTLIEFARIIAKDDPLKAFELGELAFRFGQPTNFYLLFWELRKKDSSLADRFFRRIVQSAFSDPNLQIAQNLKISVFPEIDFSNTSDSIRGTNEQRVTTLRFLADYLSQQQIRFTGNLIPSCSFEAVIVASLKNKYPIYLPDKTNAVAQSITLCLRDDSTSGTKSSERNMDRLQNPSVDELLKLADEAPADSKLRSYYLLRASSLSSDQGLYQIGIATLEKMSALERSFDPDFWDSLRFTLAAGLAYKQMENNDLSGANATLAIVPSDIRSFAKVGFSLKCSPTDKGNREFCISKIDEAVADFPKSSKSLKEKARLWLITLKLYSSLGQTRSAADSFESFVKNFNGEYRKPQNIGFSITPEHLDSVISSTLLESEEQSILSSMDLFEDETSRTRIGLGLLETSLKMVEELTDQIAKSKNSVRQ